MKIQVEIIHTNGGRVTHHVERHGAHTEIQKLIGATCTDTVNLRDGRVMLVDDNGYETTTVQNGAVFELVPTKARKPVNPEATALYHAICIPGTTHQIVGDVAIVKDSDFA